MTARLGSLPIPVLVGLLLGATPLRAQAGLLPIDMNAFTQAGPLVVELTSTLASLTGSRILAPATPLQSPLGLEVGAIVGLQMAPDSFWRTIGGTPAALPSALLQVQKKLSPFSTVGLHALVYQDFKIYGGSFAAHFFQPEEGPFLTGRFTFSWSQVSLLMTRNWGLELVGSRDVGFADPYLGVGAYLLSGTLTLSPLPGLTLQAEALAETARAFGGVQFKMPVVGLSLTLEGEYTSKQTSGLTTKVALQL